MLIILKTGHADTDSSLHPGYVFPMLPPSLQPQEGWFSELGLVTICLVPILYHMLRHGHFPDGSVDYGRLTGNEPLFQAWFSLSKLYVNTALCVPYDYLIQAHARKHAPSKSAFKKQKFLREKQVTADIGLNLSSKELCKTYGAKFVWVAGKRYNETDSEPINRLGTWIRDALNHGHVEHSGGRSIVLRAYQSQQATTAMRKVMELQLPIDGLVKLAKVVVTQVTVARLETRSEQVCRIVRYIIFSLRSVLQVTLHG